MYRGDHTPPHFHARYNGDDVTIEIQTLKVLVGKIPPRVLSLVMERSQDHQRELQENRDRLQKDGKFRKITPLI